MFKDSFTGNTLIYSMGVFTMNKEHAQNEGTEKTGGNEMNTATSSTMSLAAFIKANEELIFKITPKTTFVREDDEWRAEEYEVTSKDGN